MGAEEQKRRKTFPSMLEEEESENRLHTKEQGLAKISRMSTDTHWNLDPSTSMCQL